jgi:hypothetical protein
MPEATTAVSSASPPLSLLYLRAIAATDSNLAHKVVLHAARAVKARLEAPSPPLFLYLLAIVGALDEPCPTPAAMEVTCEWSCVTWSLRAATASSTCARRGMQHWSVVQCISVQ